MEDHRIENEISFKKLIYVLLSGRKLITGIVFVGIVLALFYSIVIAKPVYQTKATMFMSIPESTMTEMGNYKFPSNNPEDYFNLITQSEIIYKTVESNSLEINDTDFTRNLSISKQKDAKVISVTYKGNNPEEIASILNNHIDYYQHYLSFIFKEDAILQFITRDKVSLALKQNELSKLKGQLLKARNDLSELSSTIPLQKALTTNPEFAAKYARDNGLTVAELSNQLLVEEVLNSNYIAAEKLVTSLETSINTLEIEVRILNEQLEKLELEKKILEESNVFEEPKSNFLSALSLPIKKMSPASVSNYRISPRLALNIAIAVAFSGIIGVLVVFFKAYWKNEL